MGRRQRRKREDMRTRMTQRHWLIVVVMIGALIVLGNLLVLQFDLELGAHEGHAEHRHDH